MRAYIKAYDHCNFGFFNLYDYIEKPYVAADAARWAGIGSILLADSAAGQNVVNIKAGEEAKLASVSVGDPVMFYSNCFSWQLDPLTVYAGLDISQTLIWFGFNMATITAIGANTVTISRDLPVAIAANTPVQRTSYWNNFYMHYAHADSVHLYYLADQAVHLSLFDPSFKRYMVYLGKHLATVDQTTAGAVAGGGASVAAASWEAAAWPPKPGCNRTADVISNVTLGANNDSVRFPGTSCIARLAHVVRFSVVSLNMSGKGSLQCWVEDGSANVKSDVITPNMYGGIDIVNIPFTPTATGTHYLKIKQNGATDASCYVSEIEYRQIPSDGNNAVMPSGLNLLIQGDSNLDNAKACYQTTLGNPPTIREIASLNAVSGRHLAAQDQQAVAYLSRDYVVAISNETANSVAMQHSETAVDMTPVYTNSEAYTTAKYGGLAKYWACLVAEQIPNGMALFMSPHKCGEDATHGWDYTPIAADLTRQARISLGG